jgi:hypothetical protein
MPSRSSMLAPFLICRILGYPKPAMSLPGEFLYSLSHDLHNLPLFPGPGKSVQVHVASREYDRDPHAAHVELSLHDRGQGHR